jgi:hypothetical protein
MLLVAFSGCTINLDMGNILDNAQTGLNTGNQTMGQYSNDSDAKNNNNELINSYLNNIIDNFPGADDSKLVIESAAGNKIVVKNEGSTPVNNIFILINDEWLNYELDEPILPGELHEIHFSARQAGEDLAVMIIYNNGKTLEYVSPASANTIGSGFSENPSLLNDIIYPNDTSENDTFMDFNDTFINGTFMDFNDTFINGTFMDFNDTFENGTFMDFNDTFENNTVINSNNTLVNNTFYNNTITYSNSTIGNSTSSNSTIVYSNDTSINNTVID